MKWMEHRNPSSKSSPDWKKGLLWRNRNMLRGEFMIFSNVKSRGQFTWHFTNYCFPGNLSDTLIYLFIDGHHVNILFKTHQKTNPTLITRAGLNGSQQFPLSLYVLRSRMWFHSRILPNRSKSLLLFQKEHRSIIIKMLQPVSSEFNKPYHSNAEMKSYNLRLPWKDSNWCKCTVSEPFWNHELVGLGRKRKTGRFML